MLMLDARDALEPSQHQSTQEEDQDLQVRGRRAPVLPPGYPLRTFVLRQPVDASGAQHDSDGDQRYVRAARWGARAAGLWLASRRAWALVRRHGTLSLCGCLALLLLSQVGVISLLALQTHSPALPSSVQVILSDTAPDASVAHRRPLPWAARVPSEAPTGIPTTAASPTTPVSISGAVWPDTGATYNTVGQPCHGSTFFPATITQWAVPPGCFAKIYSPTPKSYPAVSGAFGWCNWWPEVLHPTHTDILTSAKYRHGSAPVPGAVVHFSPGVQGASSGGHYAQVVAVQPGSPWILVTEMNFTWRGGGFAKVDYRYVKVGAGMTFIYPD